MGLRPTQGEKSLLFSHQTRRALEELSSRPKRTRISCHAALDKTACAPFLEERRMRCDNATKLHRKSRGAQWRDLLFFHPLANVL